MKQFSLLIIVKNRRSHLQNVLRALPAASVQPSEIIIVHMNEAVCALETNYELRQIELRCQETLPLAKARNTAAQAAAYDNLVFLDVDCIPDPDCFEILLRDLEKRQLVMADPRYLHRPVAEGPLDFQALTADSKPNPARKGLAYGATQTYDLFWSLGFAISKADFEKIGGFDEQYVGYGGEDTDFAFAARQAGISLGFSRAEVYHQNHPSYDPPLNWLADIVINANRFYEKWAIWPMEGWLQQFTDLEYTEWSKGKLTLLKLPSNAEVQAQLRSDSNT